MRIKILFVSFLFTVASCQEEQPPIPIKKMANILSDVHMAESFAQLVPVDQGGYMNKNTDTLINLYNHLYQRYDLDTASFNQAIGWYKKHPTEFDKVYEQVLEKLSIRKEAFEVKEEVSEDTTAKN